MKTLLISGFLPWGKHTANSSLNLSRLADEMVMPKEWTLTSLVLPVRWQVAAENLVAEAKHADAVIAFGLAADRTSVTPESQAANACRQDALDANGQLPFAPRLKADGADFLPTRLPVGRIEQALQERSIPVQISHDAGGFICNEVFYRLLAASTIDPAIPAGFIHLPPWDLWPPEQWSGVLQSIIAATLSYDSPLSSTKKDSI